MNKNGNVLVIILSLMALVSLFLAGYFWWQNQILQKTKTETVILTPTTIVKVETSDWKVYSDPTNTFELSYPSQFNETKTRFFGMPGESKYAGDVGVLSTSIPWNAPLKDDGIRIEFNIETRRPSESLESFLARINNRPVSTYLEGKSFSKKEITVDGRKSYWLEGGALSVAHIEIYVPKDKSTFVYLSAWDEHASSNASLSGEHIELLKKILSTFRFL